MASLVRRSRRWGATVRHRTDSPRRTERTDELRARARTPNTERRQTRFRRFRTVFREPFFGLDGRYAPIKLRVGLPRVRTNSIGFIFRFFFLEARAGLTTRPRFVFHFSTELTKSNAISGSENPVQSNQFCRARRPPSNVGIHQSPIPRS